MAAEPPVTDASKIPAPKTLGYSREDVLSNLAFFFGGKQLLS